MEMCIGKDRNRNLKLIKDLYDIICILMNSCLMVQLLSFKRWHPHSNTSFFPFSLKLLKLANWKHKDRLYSKYVFIKWRQIFFLAFYIWVKKPNFCFILSCFILWNHCFSSFRYFLKYCMFVFYIFFENMEKYFFSMDYLYFFQKFFSRCMFII